MHTVLDSLMREVLLEKCNCTQCRKKRNAMVNGESESFWDTLYNQIHYSYTQQSSMPKTDANSAINRNSTAYIKWLQQSLNRVLSAGLTVDGTPGSSTKNALKKFQQRQGIVPSGIMDASTEKALVKAGVPLLEAAPNRAGTKQDTIPRRFQALIPLLNQYRGNIPLDFLLGWIQVESDGNNKVITKSLNERGYFQIHPDESKGLGLDHNRITEDSVYSIQSGIKLVRSKMKLADLTSAKLGIPKGSDLYWRITKLYHWLPLGVKAIRETMVSQGFQPKNWEEFKSFVVQNRTTIMERIRRGNKAGKVWNPMQGVNNVEKLFNAARSFNS